MGKPLAVVLVSGGMDSCLTAAIAAQNHELAALHVNYGQRTERRELQAFHAIADFFHIVHRMVVSMDHLARIGGSSLTDSAIDVPEANLHAHSVPSSYVPFRNANMLSVAVSWAEVIGATAVFVGAVEEDSSGYPDCRQAFFDAFNTLIEVGTRPETRITIKTPVIAMSKKDIVLKSFTLGAPLHLTWSCYRKEERACGVCDSCALRLRGFQQAEVEDPVKYEQRPLYSTP